MTVSGRGIGKAEPHARLRESHRSEIVVFPLLKHGVLYYRAWGHYPYNIAVHKTPRRSRVFRLLADSHLVTFFDKPRNIRLAAVVRHAAHGRALLCPAVLSGKHKVKLLGGGFRVVIEHLVKIADPEEQDTVLIVRLDTDILLHHRG